MAVPPRAALCSRLFLPDEGARWGEVESHFSAADFPVTPQMPFSFPFSHPFTFGTQRSNRETWNRAIPFTATRFAPLQLAAAPRTTGGKYSAPPITSKNLCKERATRLEYIYRSSLIWDRAKSFVLGPGQVLAPGHLNPVVLDIGGVNLSNYPPEPFPQPDCPPLTINAWDDWSQNLIPLPTPNIQADAMCGLYHHYSSQRRRFTPFVNSEPAIQAEFTSQYLTPVNLWLTTRFNRPASLYADQYEYTDETKKISSFYPEGQLLRRGRYPFWGRSIHREHVHISGKKRSGFPDMMLYDEGLPNHHPAIAEVKPWWQYATSVFHDLWTDMGSNRVISPEGRFVTGSGKSTVHNSLLIQLWGQVYFFAADYGVWTNGEIVALCMRTGRNELTFSHARPWTDPDALLGVAGLSFASVLSKAPNADTSMIINQLCPPESRLTPREEGLY